MADLTQFYARDEAGEILFDEQGFPLFKSRPETKSLDDLQRVVDKHAANPAKHSVIETFAVLYELGRQWDWLEQYLDWRRRRDEWPDQPETVTEGGDAWEAFSEPEPVYPLPIGDFKLLPGPDELSVGEYLFRASRAAAVAGIVVEVDGMLFDGDEDSQRRMLSGINAASVVGLTSTSWRLADNSIAEVTLEQLMQAHAAAIVRQGELWMPSEEPNQ